MKPAPDDPTSRLRAELVPPPPGRALAAAIATMTPVATRVPLRTFATLLAVALATGGAVFFWLGARGDLQALPLSWLFVVGVVWALAGPFLLARTILPAPGQVLPDAGRAGRTALLVAAGLIGLGLVGTIDAAQTRHAASFVGGWWHCTKVAMQMTLPLLLAGALLLRQLHPVGAGKIAWALGAAGGAWAGFVLLLVCPLGGGAHVGLAHGGATLLGGAFGALLLGRLLR